MRPESKLAQADDFMMEELDGELVLFHLGRSTIMHCNATAALVWRLCDGERTLAAIVELLAATYPEADVRAGVEAVVSRFLEAGALVEK